MKGKTIIALVMAILMVASIVSATAFANIGTLIYNRIAPQDKAQAGIQTITNTGQNNPSSCTTQSDCPNGNCACKCAAKPAAGGSDVLAPLTGKVTIPISNLKLSPSTASSGTLIAAPAPRTAGQTCSANLPCATGLTCTSGKCVAQTAARTAGQSCSTNLPCATGLSCTGGVCAGQAAANTGGAAGTDTTTVGECQSACLARCRAACTPSVAGSAGTVSCASNADCTVGYCRIIPSSVAPSTTGTCVPCTTNSNCGTGKTCNTATGQCAASAAGVSGLLSSGTKLALTGKAITLSNLNIGDKTALPAKLANGVTCTSNTQCTNGLCSAGKCAAPTAAKTAGQTCTTTQQCATGLNCDSARKVCVRQTALRTAGQSCSTTQPCATGLICTGSVCVAPAATPRTAGQSCSATQLCATGLTCTSSICTAPVAGTDTVGRCQAACTETCRLECTPSGEQTPPPAGSDDATTGTKKIGELCSSSEGCKTECESEYGECSCERTAVTTGRGARKQNNDACDSSPQCISGYCDKIFPDRTGICSIEGTIGTKTIGEECNANTQCETGSCQLRERRTGMMRVLTIGGGPEAACAEPLERDLEIGEQCFTHFQCKSIYCDMTARTCAEAPPVPKLPLGERCVENEACESNYCSTDPETLRKICANPEPLSLEVQTQVRTQLNTLEPKLERMEQQVVADRLVASREALVALSARPDCYVTINDVELKAECLKIRFETVTDLLQSKGIFTADKAMELKTRVGGQGQAVAQERRAEVKASPPPAKTFTQRVKDVFRITGSFWRVTGGFVVDETEVQVGTAGEELRVVEAIPTNYLNDLDTQYNALAALETDICSKYPTTLTSASVLKSCTTNLQCGASGAVKCVSGKCRVDKAEVCTVGEFTGTAAATTETVRRCVAPERTKANGVTCTTNSQCTSGYCNGMAMICADPSRFGLKFNGEACTANAQCISAYCNRAVGMCAIPVGKKDLGEPCTGNAQCDSGYCKTPTEAGTKIYGEACTASAECLTGLCRTSTCACRTNAHCLEGQICNAERQCVTDIPASTEEGEGFMEEDILPPATCDSPIGFEIVSFCRGEESSGIAFVNISLRNTADIDINGFGLSLYKTDNSIISLPASTLPLLAARTEYLKKISLSRSDSNFRGRSRVNPRIGTEQCNDKQQFFGIEGTLLPLCKGQPCTEPGACASRTCSAGVCQ